jgi:hypothetical protein
MHSLSDSWRKRSLSSTLSEQTPNISNQGECNVDIWAVFTICSNAEVSDSVSSSPKERDHWQDQGIGGKMGSEWILGRLAWGVWIIFDCLRTGTGGGLLWVRWWTFGFLRHGVS